MRVLLADDQDEDVFLLTEAFRMAGIDPTITRAVDGESVLNLTAPPAALDWDILILDLNLPKLDGAAVLAQLKNWDVLSRLPCIVFSSHIQPAKAAHLSELGVRLIAEKPTELERLCELARQFAAAAQR